MENRTDEVALTTLEEVFKHVLAGRYGAPLPAAIAPDPYAEEMTRLARMSDDAVKALWDQWDCCTSVWGFSGEAIHMDLNRRGLGEYCAV